MNKIFVIPLLFVGVVVTTLALPAGGDKLPIGGQLPLTSVRMVEVAGGDISLMEIRKQNGVLVLFSCNTCPYVLAWENRYNEIADACAKNDIGFVIVNSNEAQRDSTDSWKEMRKHADKMKYRSFYAIDKESALADALGADRTPEAFLFNGQLKLAYTGAIDDNAKDKGAVKKHYLLDAINAVAQGKEIAVPVTKSIGCSIKRKS